MYKKLFILFIVNLVFVLKAQDKIEYTSMSKQDAAKLFQKINKWYTTTPSYSFNVSHATFAGYNAVKPYEFKKGYFKKFSSGFHSDILEIHTVQNKNYLITVDSVKKIILVADPVKKFEGSGFDLTEYEKSLGRCISISVSTSKMKIIKMEFEKNYPIASYEIILNNDDLLQSIVIYYRREVKLKTGQMVKPKLSINFENYAFKINPEKDELNEKKYFSINGSQLELKEAYKNFTLHDQRIKNTNQ